jgi:hypothetical protein
VAVPLLSILVLTLATWPSRVLSATQDAIVVILRGTPGLLPTGTGLKKRPESSRKAMFWKNII